MGEVYVRVILALAPFVVCLAISLERQRWSLKLWLASALLFSLSVFAQPFSVWGALPWLGLISVTALKDFLEFARQPRASAADLSILASALYLPVGGVWAVLYQLGLQPLGFSGIIVLLTGVHFHYAGFALPRLTGLWLRESGYGGVFELAAWGVIMGVPLVAVGITSSQLGMPFWIEIVAVSILAVAAFLISLGQIQWALKAPITPLARVLFVLAGLSLAAGMVLATIYGWRYLFPIAWVTIPSMYSLHGTLNSLGFCLPGFVAWKIYLGSVDIQRSSSLSQLTVPGTSPE